MADGGCRVLVVDDLESIRATIASLVRGLGMKPFSAACVSEAMTLFEDYRFKLVLTDLAMPNGNGLTFIKWIRAHAEPQIARTPVIVVTGHAKMDVIALAMQVRANGIVAKPLVPSALTRTIRQVMAREAKAVPAELDKVGFNL